MDSDKVFQVIMIFSAGVVVGAASAFYFLKDYYKDLADEEIEQVREMYQSRVSKDKSDVKTNKHGYISTTPSIEYNTMVKEYNQVNEKKGEEYMAKRMHPVEDDKDIPYVINPEDFDDPAVLNQTTTCSFDPISGIVVDDVTREEIDRDILGEDNLEFFAKSDESTIYIRNDSISTDFEVIKAENLYEGYEA